MAAKRELSPAQIAVRLAGQVLGQLVGAFKNDQISKIRVAILFARVRDEKLYLPLHHDTIEEYAEERLRLSRTSLYRYLNIYDWVAKYHKEWLVNRPKGFIPDLSDISGLIWIEKELEQKRLTAERRATLKVLRQKALEGRLIRTELDKVRRRKSLGPVSLKSLLSSLRAVRRRAANLGDVPPGVMTRLDEAIELLKNDQSIAQWQLDDVIPALRFGLNEKNRYA